MKTLLILLLTGVLLTLETGTWAQERKNPDSPLAFTTVRTKDRSLFVGKIIQQDEKEIYFEDNVLGKVTIPMKEVRSVTQEIPDSRYEIELSNGNTFIGTISYRRENDFFFDTKKFGMVRIKPECISHMQQLDATSSPVDDATGWFPNPNATRYLFAPSAIPLKKGEGYYQNAWVIANSANYGVSNHVSLGGGVLLPVAAYITPKVSAKLTDGFYAGAGVIAAILPEGDIAGIGYGLTTFGNPENNLTFGMGYGFVNDTATQKPILTINGMARVSEKVALVSENWIVSIDVSSNQNHTGPDQQYKAFVSYGVRFMWDRFTIDAAFINGYEIVEMFPIGVPYIDFIMRF